MDDSQNQYLPGSRAASMEPLPQPLGQAVHLLFPSALTVMRWPDSDEMNAALRRIVLEESQRSQHRLRSNVGGWSSDKQFLQREDPAIQQLLGRINRVTGELIETFNPKQPKKIAVTGWANMLRPGGYNRVHGHVNSTWSGVYYVTGVEASEQKGDVSGHIEFIDPRPLTGLSYSEATLLRQRVTVRPEAGMMVVFPSWLLHCVHPVIGDADRISIAFNVIVTTAST